jgi:hypothetical protein
MYVKNCQDVLKILENNFMGVILVIFLINIIIRRKRTEPSMICALFTSTKNSKYFKILHHKSLEVCIEY